MHPSKRFHVYIMTNGPLSAVLYTGITGDLRHRVWQRKNKIVQGFTRRYNLTSLVYYEEFVYPDAAIAREKEMKGWRRSKKIRLVESMNPRWEDLAREWQDVYKPEGPVRASGTSVATRTESGRGRSLSPPEGRLRSG